VGGVVEGFCGGLAGIMVGTDNRRSTPHPRHELTDASFAWAIENPREQRGRDDHALTGRSG
jgi:hypothetical protein